MCVCVCDLLCHLSLVTAGHKDGGGHLSHVEGDSWCQCWVSDSTRKVGSGDHALLLSGQTAGCRERSRVTKRLK